MQVLKSNCPNELKNLIGRRAYLIDTINGVPPLSTGYIRSIERGMNETITFIVEDSGQQISVASKSLRLFPIKISEFKDEIGVFQNIVKDLEIRFNYMEENHLTEFIERDFKAENVLGEIKKAENDAELLAILIKNMPSLAA